MEKKQVHEGLRLAAEVSTPPAGLILVAMVRDRLRLDRAM